MGGVERDLADRKAFAARLSAEIARRHLSHRRLAAMVETSKQSVTNWTQGTHEPSLRYLRRLSVALQVPVALLVDGETDGDHNAQARKIVEELADLDLSSSLGSFSRASPALLDLLGRAERQARRRRGGAERHGH